MTVQISRLKKDEIIKLAKMRCVHGHTLLEHPQCIPDDVFREKIGFLDIEAAGLKADFSIMISYAILDSDSGKILGRAIRPSELKTCLDEKLLRDLVRDLKKFDRVITFYGTRFDLPFARVRALTNGVDFPGMGEIKHTDLYFMVKSKFYAMSRRSLDNSCRVLLGKSDKTHLTGKQWSLALAGNKKAIEYIWNHNQIDVQLTRDLYEKIKKFSRKNDTSI